MLGLVIVASAFEVAGHTTSIDCVSLGHMPLLAPLAREESFEPEGLGIFAREGDD